MSVSRTHRKQDCWATQVLHTVRKTLRNIEHTARSLSSAGLVVLCALASLPVHAATQGPIGNTSSTGTVDVDLVLGLLTRISGLADLPLGVWSGSGSLTANDNICIGRTGQGFFSGPYRIRASGDGEPGDPAAFTLSNGAQTLKYNAFFNDAANAGPARTQLTAGVTLTGQNSFGLFQAFNMFGCIFNNANISVEVPEAELAGGTGTYSGTLTLLLLPE